MFLGEKKIVKLLHFPNITPNEQRRLLMSESGSDNEHRQMAAANDGINHKQSRKKSSTKRSLDMQRKISLSKLKDEKKEKDSNCHNNHCSTADSSTAPVNNVSTPTKHKPHRKISPNGKISDGYDQYLKQYLLQVPMPKDYGEPSSDDLSSEWDSDVPDIKNNEAKNKESKVSFLLKISFWCVNTKQFVVALTTQFTCRQLKFEIKLDES